MIPQSVLKWRAECEKWAAVYAQKYQIPFDWREIAAIMTKESWGNPFAVNPYDPSWGLMQITHLIAKTFAGVDSVPTRSLDLLAQKTKPSFGYDISHVIFSPSVNIQAGAGFLAYLKHAHSAQFPNYVWIAMYNAGEPAVIKGLKDEEYVSSFLSNLKDLQAIS
jgi:soluble lytic murein transglycosylase-like protein